MNWNLLKRCVRFNVETINGSNSVDIARSELWLFHNERCFIRFMSFFQLYVVRARSVSLPSHLFPLAANIAWIIKLAEVLAWFFKSIAPQSNRRWNTSNRNTVRRIQREREREREREKKREKDRTNATMFLQRLFFVTYGEFNVGTQRSVST